MIQEWILTGKYGTFMEEINPGIQLSHETKKKFMTWGWPPPRMPVATEGLGWDSRA